MSRELQKIGLQCSQFVICPVKQAENTSGDPGHLNGSNTGTKKG
jgi:hypothetical protein